MRGQSEEPKEVTGYLHRGYAQSLATFGSPRMLSKSGGWVLKRKIPGYPYYDAIGCYPLFFCQDWSQLRFDLANLQSELVSVTLVADPFGEYELGQLQNCFELVVPFKEHFVIDLDVPLSKLGSKHHRYYARRASRQVLVEVCSEPTEWLASWSGLYANLKRRHRIDGIKAFSDVVFAQQLDLPGTVLFRAIAGNDTVGMDWYYEQNDVVYGHLAAVSPKGYRVGASYALQWAAINYFIGRAHWMDLGGAAGLEGNGTDGLSFFKKGWSNATRTSYLCGRIFQQEKYSRMAEAEGILTTDYFPSYRKGEFT